ncbi:conserved hypothetical protein [uncultured Eubacteriales bacterium]|uniref:Single-stranded DNA-binding protein n=1 Tax=uncultured Eubacteriales bacterium TaxID=172733 RepID=A0A212JSW9_9FIRM|nr:conserved hypothetical protein [uncultured Eubacteriales bacterium]
MQTQFKDGSVMVCGGCSRDAKLEYVGDAKKRICKVGIAVGKNEDTTTKWANVVAWHDTAAVLSKAKKGDSVFVIGKLNTREYNGKPYTDLVADFVSVCSPSAAATSPPPGGFQPAGDGIGVDAGDFGADDGELPF